MGARFFFCHNHHFMKNIQQNTKQSMKKHVQKIIAITTILISSAIFITVLQQSLFYSSRDDITYNEITANAAVKKSKNKVVASKKIVKRASSRIAYIPSDAIPLDTSSPHPITISIPSINVSASVQKVGITHDNKIAVPTNFTDVGWYKKSAMPGSVGNVIMDGHVNNGLAFPAVFSRLEDLTAGDSIFITMSDGAVIEYTMRESASYSKDEKNIGRLLVNKQEKLLRLITCTGTWLPSQRTHDQRLVITAVQK